MPQPVQASAPELPPPPPLTSSDPPRLPNSGPGTATLLSRQGAAPGVPIGVGARVRIYQPQAEYTDEARQGQECLQNVVAKHSGTKNVSACLGFEKGAALLAIEDDGAGFDPKALMGRGRLGFGMEERARLVKGKLTMAQRGHGTQIAVEVPLKAVK